MQHWLTTGCGPSAGGLFRQYCGLCLRGGAWRAEGKAAGMRGAYSTPAVHAYSHPGKVQSDEGSLLEGGGRSISLRRLCFGRQQLVTTGGLSSPRWQMMRIQRRHAPVISKVR